jgi:DNA polymerase-3 subunit delta
MRIKAEQLAQHLQKSLLGAYVVFGEEDLLVDESLSLIRQRARQVGFDERVVFHIDSKTDWQPILDEAISLGLFTQRKLIELQLPSGNLGASGGQKLIECVARADDDLLWVIVCAKLDTRQQKSAWFAHIEQQGAVVAHPPVKAAQLPAWLSARLRARGLSASPQALETLAWYLEGNLLAANQEVERLALLYPGARLSREQIEASVSENARFGVFSLTETWLSSSAIDAVRVLNQQRDEGQMPPVIVSLLAKEFTVLARLAFIKNEGGHLGAACKELKVWDSKAQQLQMALGKFTLAQWRAGLVRLAEIDAASKGQGPGDPWLLLEELLLDYEVCR